LRLCYLWYVLYVHDGAYGLGSFWSPDACYELSYFNIVNMINNFETWNLVTAGIGN
jgi:hypothetical protein